LGGSAATWLKYFRASSSVSSVKNSKHSRKSEFPKARTALRKGQAVEIGDANAGESFVVTAKPPKTFGELAARAMGAYAGSRNLSAREGFGG
jgi:hypothetical protein